MEAYSLAVNVVISCWIVFVATWLLAALSTKRTVYRESPAQRLRYWLLLLIAYLLLMYGRQLPYPLNMRVLPHAAPVACTGALLCIAGLGVALWARLILGRNWSGVVTLKEGHELVECGPYRFVRHPIYTGILTMSFATALVLGHLAGFVGTLLMFVSFWIKLGHEEKLMLQQFPERYAAYQRRAKRLIPFLL
ncbi:MAG TPA: isoprenylcysteine carboxylmethyltransferase family protein [Candidatus Udaeobacter sp.]|jgi:protein-S-isoprenylcysteine O-methyltransferase Ste14|nr:isoprenylcysteine carboxylmethyltransferase family protein [Candidatus Udaeobacter sp.]